MRSGMIPSEAVVELSKSRAELELDVACLKEQNNLAAIQRGMPAIGAKMVNAHGIEWIVDGHTTAPSMTTLGNEDELYPAVIPQNLSTRLYGFAREIDFCTPKALVPLDTMPRKFPHRGHPGGHWVDAWSEAYRILFFLDIANLHETVYAHELAHVWLDLVMDVEDYRVWKDRSDTPRYSQVQMLQSFVLDQAVDDVLRKKGFDLSIVEQDKERANRQLAQAVQSGYIPPTKREAVSLASFLAASAIELEQGTSITRYGDHILAVRSAIPEIVNLAQNFACAVQNSPPVDRESTMTAVDHVLELAFNETDAGLDFHKNLIEVPPRISYDHDKHPDWMPRMPVKAKCELGVAMARTGATAEARWELSHNPAGGLRVRFQEPNGRHTDYTDLKSIDRIPESREEQIQRITEMSASNRQRIDTIVKDARERSQQTRQSFAPQIPGGRTYSPGLACWITQARLEEQFAGEHPYSYAKNNPTTYTDPSGENPDRVGPCAVYVCRQYGWGPPPTPPTHKYLCVTGPNGGCAGGLYPGGDKGGPYEWGVPGRVGDQEKDCKNKAANPKTGQYRVDCEDVTNRTPPSLKCDVAAAFCECVRILSRKPPRYEGLNVCYAFPHNLADCVRSRTSGPVQAEVLNIQSTRL